MTIKSQLSRLIMTDHRALARVPRRTLPLFCLGNLDSSFPSSRSSSLALHAESSTLSPVRAPRCRDIATRDDVIEINARPSPFSPPPRHLPELSCRETSMILSTRTDHRRIVRGRSRNSDGPNRPLTARLYRSAIARPVHDRRRP